MQLNLQLLSPKTLGVTILKEFNLRWYRNIAEQGTCNYEEKRNWPFSLVILMGDRIAASNRWTLLSNIFYAELYLDYIMLLHNQSQCTEKFDPVTPFLRIFNDFSLHLNRTQAKYCNEGLEDLLTWSLSVFPLSSGIQFSFRQSHIPRSFQPPGLGHALTSCPYSSWGQLFLSSKSLL